MSFMSFWNRPTVETGKFVDRLSKGDEAATMRANNHFDDKTPMHNSLRVASDGGAGAKCHGCGYGSDVVAGSTRSGGSITPG
jgi:hypothetical protein